MKITGFIPNPEMATEVVEWALSFAESDDKIDFLCFERRFSEQTQLANLLMGFTISGYRQVNRRLQG